MCVCVHERCGYCPNLMARWWVYKHVPGAGEMDEEQSSDSQHTCEGTEVRVCSSGTGLVRRQEDLWVCCHSVAQLLRPRFSESLLKIGGEQ